jgi:hypothetical protein
MEGRMASLIQRLVLRLPKRWSDAIQADSERWLLTCPVCGTVRSVWDIGGVRYKAYSRGKVTGVWCTTCKAFRLMPMTWKA